MRYYGDRCLDQFSPAGLKVLVVDDDPFCLAVLERMLRECKYSVTTCSRATTALTMLRERKGWFDVVISDVHMPDMDGFKLLELIGLELGLPVIMMSANGETDVVMKGVVYGACDYLVKPVRIEELRNIWQHVVRRRTKDSSPPPPGIAATAAAAAEEWEDFMRSTPPTDSSEETDPAAEPRKKKRLSDGDDCDRSIHSSKKARVVWSFDLHQQFVKAINHIGIDKAVPKRILEVMNIQGLTRENVASHLQKYRLYLKRLSGINPEPFPIASFQAYENATFGGTMQVQHPTAASKASLIRTRSSPAAAAAAAATVAAGGGYNATTVATLKQLQALQQAAHEKGHIDFVGGGGGGSCGGAAAAIPRASLRVGEDGEFGGGDRNGSSGNNTDGDGRGVVEEELFVRLKNDDRVAVHGSLPASFHSAVFHRHHI